MMLLFPTAVPIEKGETFSVQLSGQSPRSEDIVRSWTFTTSQQDSAFAISATGTGYGYYQLRAGKGTDFLDIDSVVADFSSRDDVEDIFVFDNGAWLVLSGSSSTYVDVNVTLVSRSGKKNR